MSPSDPQDKPASDASRMAVLEASVLKLTGMLEHVMQAIGAKAATPQTAQLAAAPMQQAVARESDEFDPEALYWVRIKPYDEKRGLFRRRMLVPELGMPLDGGSGKPGDIPPWVPVKGAVAIQLLKYHQTDDPNSHYVFDIATQEEREEIDAAESRMRMASLGMIGMTPQQMLEQANQAGAVNAQTRTMRKFGRPPTAGPRATPQRVQPTMIPGAEVYNDQSALGIPAARTKALQGLPPAPPPPPVAPPPAAAAAPPEALPVPQPIAAAAADDEDAPQGEEPDLQLGPPVRKRRTRLDREMDQAQAAFGGQVTGRALAPKQ